MSVMKIALHGSLFFFRFAHPGQQTAATGLPFLERDACTNAERQQGICAAGLPPLSLRQSAASAPPQPPVSAADTGQLPTLERGSTSRLLWSSRCCAPAASLNPAIAIKFRLFRVRPLFAWLVMSYFLLQMLNSRLVAQKS